MYMEIDCREKQIMTVSMVLFNIFRNTLIKAVNSIFMKINRQNHICVHENLYKGKL